MGYVLRFRSNEDVAEYKEAEKKAKNGLAMIMEGVDNNDMSAVMEGVEKAWKGVKKMTEISSEMEEQYGERRNDGMQMRDAYSRRNYSNRHNDEWNERDEEWMERRMRDSMGRFK